MGLEAQDWARCHGFCLYSVPGDGHCLYTSIGLILQLTAAEVRAQMNIRYQE